MNGLCTRWSVLYKHDKTPIEGCLYIHKAKAEKRMLGMKNPENFEVGQICVLPQEVMNRILSAIPSK
jgi:hypothetical protein